MHGYNPPLEACEVAVPDAGPTQVLIKVAATGMSRSDF
jgi:propanol-preferring alcohol dehydrogenase